jgi:hypothetical protein
MAALSMVLQNFPKDNTLPITKRVAVAAETTKEKVKRVWGTTKDKMAAVLAMFSGDSSEEQQVRLRFYLKYLSNHLKHHPKRMIIWVLTGNMPVKNPDGRVSDAQYQEYYVLFKKLLKGEDLTYDEEVAARQEGMQRLYEYRHAKGLPQVSE